MWYLIYNIFFTFGFFLALLCLPLLLCLGARYRDGLGQRLGFYPDNILPRLPGGRPVWIHAASVGEVRSAEALIAALKSGAAERRILLSTFTATGHRLARQMAGVDAVIYFPLDLFWIAGRALARFDPSLLVIIETEIWPNFLLHAYRRGIPTLLLSGRLSVKAAARYRLCQSFFRRVLGCFNALGMQSSEDAARIVDLGATEKKVSVVGSLKFASLRHGPLVETMAAALAGKPLLVAGSTHHGEEEKLLEALLLIRAKFPTLAMVLAPRHPERFVEVERLLKNSPFNFQRRSQTQAPHWFSKDILLLDSVGELVDFFAAADVAFVGGSLAPVGGHNILEPARFGKPVLFGPHMENFHSLAQDMIRQGAALEVSGAEDLATAVSDLLADPQKSQAMGRRAAKIAAGNYQALGLNLRLAQRYL